MASSQSTSKSLPPVLTALIVALLVFIWHRNYNLLGNLYDYSIIASAAGYLENGLTPYRSFSTPLQSLTLYLGYFCELLFGRRYLSLAWGNLIIGLASFFVMLRLLKPALPYATRLIAASAFCACTFFQHGIIWYNPLAMTLLAFICFQSANLFHANSLGVPRVAVLCLLLVFSSMTKINYHLMAMALAALFLAARFWTRRTGWKTVLATALPLSICGFVLGPTLEILVNHATLRAFIHDVLVLPSGRSAIISEFLKPRLYYWRIHNYYPDNCCIGVYVIGFIAYACYGWLALKPAPKETASPQPAAPLASRRLHRKLLIPLFLAILFAGSLLLTVSNIETEMLTSVFLLVGLISTELLLADRSSQSARSPARAVLAILALYFLVAGGMSAFMHSRVRFLEESRTEAIAREIRREKKLSPLWEPLPTYDAETISPEFKTYLAGVRFTAPAEARLKRVAAFMAQTHSGRDAQDIYWGPGFEMLNRVYGNRLNAYLPLWYHGGVTIRDQDSQTLTQELDRAHYEWVVMPSKLYNMPNFFLEYLATKYRVVENDEIIVYQRIQP